MPILRLALVALLSLSLAGCGQRLLNFISGGSPAESDIAYGTEPRQKFDVYRPANAGPNTPVIIFFYGGGWHRGDKHRYRFVGNALADEGFIVAIPDYRLFPDVLYPAFVKDGAAAVAAIKRELAPDRPVFLAGHSAGAHIAALLSLDSTYLRLEGLETCEAIAGIFGIAGPYDFLPLKTERLRKTFPEELRPNSQPINHAGGRDPAALLVHGSADTTVHDEDSRLLAEALRLSGGQAEVKIYEGVDHIDIVGAIAPLIDGRAPTRADFVSFVRNRADVRGDTCKQAAG